MANPFFEAFGNAMMQSAPSNNAGSNIFTMAQQFKANPLGFLMQKKLKLGPNINTHDPNEMLNYLVNSGQIPQSRVEWAKQKLSSLGGTR